jgi:hypothetical protein
MELGTRVDVQRLGAEPNRRGPLATAGQCTGPATNTVGLADASARRRHETHCMRDGGR